MALKPVSLRDFIELAFKDGARGHDATFDDWFERVANNPNPTYFEEQKVFINTDDQTETLPLTYTM